MRVENRSSSVWPDRSASEFRTSFEELYAMVASIRSWDSAECWLSPNVSVIRHQREAQGRDGEEYTWTRVVVFEAKDGRCTRMCEFDDEAAAFAFAQERVRHADQR
jgi:hypothetical protein